MTESNSMNAHDLGLDLHHTATNIRWLPATTELHWLNLFAVLLYDLIWMLIIIKEVSSEITHFKIALFHTISSLRIIRILIFLTCFCYVTAIKVIFIFCFGIASFFRLMLVRNSVKCLLQLIVENDFFVELVSFWRPQCNWLWSTRTMFGGFLQRLELYGILGSDFVFGGALRRNFTLAIGVKNLSKLWVLCANSCIWSGLGHK